MTLGDATARAMIAAVDGPKQAAPTECALPRGPFPVTAGHEARGEREGVCPLVFAVREHTGIGDWVLYDPEAPGDLWSLYSETWDGDIWIDGGVRHAVDGWNGGGGWHTGERLDPRFVLADIEGAAFVEYVDEYQALDVLQSSGDGRREWCDEACSTGADFDEEYRDLRDDGRHVRIVRRRVRVLDEQVIESAAPVPVEGRSYVAVGDRVQDPHDGTWREVMSIDPCGTAYMADGGCMSVAECAECEIRLPGEALS